jgi:hypothetical protein
MVRTCNAQESLNFTPKYLLIKSSTLLFSLQNEALSPFHIFWND